MLQIKSDGRTCMKYTRRGVERSRLVILVSYCILCQSIRARGTVLRFSAVVSPIVKFLMEKNINIIQMPCPEMTYQGIVRSAAKKDVYDNAEFRGICREHALQIRRLLQELRRAGFQIIAILGIENSPTCGVNFVFREGKGRVHESGVFFEELKKSLEEHNIVNVPFIGVKIFAIEQSLLELQKFVGRNAFID